MAEFSVDISFNLNGSVPYRTFQASNVDEVLNELDKIWGMMESDGHINQSNEFFLNGNVEIESDFHNFYFGSFDFSNGTLILFTDFYDGLTEESWSENGFDTSLSFESQKELQDTLFSYFFEFEKNSALR
jgi:hypothetical protein